MKTKKMLVVVTLVLFFSLSINVFANCGGCEKPKTSCSDKPPVEKAEKVEKEAEVLKEGEIPLSKVPKKIKEVAKKAVKGIKFSEAEIEDGNYELEGFVGKVKYEIEITPKGKLIKVEIEDDKDDDCEIEVGNGNPTAEITE